MMKKPSYEDEEKCLRLRRNSKRGLPVSAEDFKFCDGIRRKFPYWYAQTEKQIFEETKPFGAR